MAKKRRMRVDFRSPVRHAPNSQWSTWQKPSNRNYYMICCDCGLTHCFDFRVNRGDGKVDFRVRRAPIATARARKSMNLPPTGDSLFRGIH